MYTLIIGNKNYSSWSLRAWLALRATGIPFSEQKLGLFTPEFAERLGGITPAGLVPVLLDGDFAVWDSLAICEYAAERHPEAGLWPADPHARARARSLAAQMHSGFGQLRQLLPMNVEAKLSGIDYSAAQGDISRVQAIWHDTRAEFGQGGPFLFGKFSAADAFYAPVVSRFTTYGVPAAGAVREYMDAVLALPAMQEWTGDACAEGVFVPADEPYRTHR
ncbi:MULTISPECIES: glutathione S-transferase family protein [Bordetella]|uniref:Glutathione S-transferase n=2 Tax=Bordetella TaxID=517 RepID=A0A261V994_9BORD|nr:MULTISPECIES: glutathione S-transferase family protein [Bordetella]MDM9559015.1 glutathione S-transferase family protein [Bordetella petrii]OZI69733.1 glutathione S-transferase [Bordetella genomosp. 2]